MQEHKQYNLIKQSNHLCQIVAFVFFFLMQDLLIGCMIWRQDQDKKERQDILIDTDHRSAHV